MYQLGPQQLTYSANIQPKPRPILKIPCLSRKYPASFNKKHTPPTQQVMKEFPTHLGDLPSHLLQCLFNTKFVKLSL